MKAFLEFAGLLAISAFLAMCMNYLGDHEDLLIDTIYNVEASTVVRYFTGK